MWRDRERSVSWGVAGGRRDLARARGRGRARGVARARGARLGEALPRSPRLGTRRRADFGQVRESRGRTIPLCLFCNAYSHETRRESTLLIGEPSRLHGEGAPARQNVVSQFATSETGPKGIVWGAEMRPRQEAHGKTSNNRGSRAKRGWLWLRSTRGRFEPITGLAGDATSALTRLRATALTRPSS